MRAGNTDKLKLDSSSSDWKGTTDFHTRAQYLLTSGRQVPRPIFTLVSGDVGLVPELGSVLNKLHSVVPTARDCETKRETQR